MFKKWDEDNVEIPDSMIGLRDLIINCLCMAHHEEIKRLTQDKSDQAIYEFAKQAVATCFELSLGDFDNPKTEDLYAVIEYLSDRSETWGVSRQIIDTNREKVKAIIQEYEKTHGS